MNKRLKYQGFVIFFFSLLMLSVSAWPVSAYDVAPRISDREIIESLSELKQGQKNLKQSMDQRFESMDKRFEDMNQRFESMHNLILTLFASVMALVVALIGYMIWDRKTAQQPLKYKLGRLETEFIDISNQLELGNPSGPVIKRVLASFRQLAETDEKVASILRANLLL